MMRQLGVLSADRIPKVYLLRRDATIAWSISGYECKSDFGYPFAIRLAMKFHIEVCDTEMAFRALQQNNLEQARKFLSGPFLLEIDERYRWIGPRFHGLALAPIGLGDWEAALADIDVAIFGHQEQFKYAKDKPGASMLEMRRLRATILEKLGRVDEAKEEYQFASTPVTEYPRRSTRCSMVV